MDWNASGIINSFEYELIDPFQLDLSLGFLEGVENGSITESYRGDYRVTASIDIDGEFPPIRPLIRVWHVAELGDEVVREELGTFTQGRPTYRYRNGRRVGSIPLYSAMYRLSGHLRAGDSTIKAGTVVAGHFESIVKNAGGVSWLHPALDEKATFSADRVWESGKTVLSECHACADALGGTVGVDTHGRVTIERYQRPAVRSDSFAIDSETARISRDGVSVTTAEWHNCAIVSATVNDREYVGIAKVDESHPLHMRKVGYWRTDYTTLSDPPDSGVQAAVDTAARARLDELMGAPNIYSANLLYKPISCGEVGTFWYQDSDDDDEGLFVRALVTQREITLDQTMSMKLTMEEVS